MAETDPESQSDEKKDDAGSKQQLDLFASKQDKVADKLDAVATAVSAQAAALQQVLARPAQQDTQKKIDWLADDQVWDLVGREQINQQQAMAYLNKKARAEAREEARRETEMQLGRLREQGRDQLTDGKIQAYVKAIPELGQRGSKAWNEVAARYKELCEEDGYEPNLKTQLIALREIYGKDPSEHSERITDRTKERVTRGGESTGGSSARATTQRRGGSVKDDVADLPQEYRSYLQKMVNIRQMSGPDDPKYKKYVARVRKSLGAE